jgi:hypothetical protein
MPLALTSFARMPLALSVCLSLLQLSLSLSRSVSLCPCLIHGTDLRSVDCDGVLLVLEVMKWL